MYRKSREEAPKHRLDLLQHILDHSEFLNAKENKWMKSIVEIIRNTSLFFQPQIRTKIMNEGWASYWHEALFLKDERIGGHEVEYARTNAFVTSLPRVGLNPYALGLRMFHYIEGMADKGRYSIEYRMMLDQRERDRFDRKAGKGREAIFDIRENFCDFMFINTFVDQDFVDRHRLFVAGRRLNSQKMVWEYYVKGRNAGDYKKMVLDTLYHPPRIEIVAEKCVGKTLYLDHLFEGRPLVKEFIANTMLGIEYLWGGPVKLETSEVIEIRGAAPTQDEIRPSDIKWERVVYEMEGRKLSRTTL
jgi:stage V sporulation protein R